MVPKCTPLKGVLLVSRLRASLAAAGLAVTLAIATPGVASAAPSSGTADPSDPSSTTSPTPVEAEDVTALEEQIAKLTLEMLSTADTAAMATGQAAVAKDQAKTASIERQVAEVQAYQAQTTATEVVRQMYMRGPVSLEQMTLLAADGPQEFMDRVAMSDYITDYQTAHIDAMIAAEEALKAAETAATAAADQAQQAADQAQQTAALAQEKLAAKQIELDTLKAEYYAQHPDQIPPPTADVPAYAMSPAGLSGATTGQWALPAKGTFTSCFCARWGTFHYGIDIAAPIGTPIWAAGSGVVLKAGPASGFGLAVYIQHPSGEVTVYGHVNQYFVQTGQQVTAGQHIADIGNRGYSTGPHLHFEVQKSAYGTRVDPVSWLAARGITVG